VVLSVSALIPFRSVSPRKWFTLLVTVV